MKRALMVATLCVLTMDAIAVTPPPPSAPFQVMNWFATLHKKPTAGISLGKLRIQFEETTLDQMKRAASAGEIAYQGDASESISWLCYTISDQGRMARLWVTSGEMGGNTFVDGIIARRLRDAKPTADCHRCQRTCNPFRSTFQYGSDLPMTLCAKRLGHPRM